MLVLPISSFPALWLYFELLLPVLVRFRLKSWLDGQHIQNKTVVALIELNCVKGFIWLTPHGCD